MENGNNKEKQNINQENAPQSLQSVSVFKNACQRQFKIRQVNTVKQEIEKSQILNEQLIEEAQLAGKIFQLENQIYHQNRQFNQKDMQESQCQIINKDSKNEGEEQVQEYKNESLKIKMQKSLEEQESNDLQILEKINNERKELSNNELQDSIIKQLMKDDDTRILALMMIEKQKNQFQSQNQLKNMQEEYIFRFPTRFVLKKQSKTFKKVVCQFDPFKLGENICQEPIKKSNKDNYKKYLIQQQQFKAEQISLTKQESMIINKQKQQSNIMQKDEQYSFQKRNNEDEEFELVMKMAQKYI